MFVYIAKKAYSKCFWIVVSITLGTIEKILLLSMKQKNTKNQFKKISIDILLIAGVILLLATVTFFLLQNIKSARQDGIFADRASITEQLLKKKQIKTTSVKDIESIDSWMTFQYINLIFSLPDSYLKEKLAINDKKYPNIPI